MGCGNSEYKPYPIEQPIIIQYGEEIPYSKFELKDNVAKQTSSEKKNPSTGKFEYDKEFISEQTAKFIYEGEEYLFQLKIEPVELTKPTIYYRDNKIDWTKIPNAEKYQVSINGLEIGTKKDEYSLEDDVFTKEEIKIKVKAIGENIKYKDSGYSNEIVITKLSKPSNIKIEDKDDSEEDKEKIEIVWDSVNKSTRYDVWINDIHQEVITEKIEISLKEGENKIEIRAKAEEDNKSDSYILWSDAETKVFYKFSPVSNIQCSEGGFAWDSVEENCKYKVTVDKEEPQETLEPFLKYELETGKTYSVSVQVIPKEDESKQNYKYVASKEVTNSNLQYYQLDKPKPVLKGSDVDYVVEFSPIEHATNYKIQVIEYIGAKSTSKSYEIEQTSKEFKIGNQATKVEVIVQAIDKTGEYAKSDVAKVEKDILHKKLEKPKVIISKGDYSDTYVVECTKVENADQYEIEVVQYTKNGKTSKKYTIEATKREITVDKDAVSLEVRVIAKNKSGVHEDSEVATAIKNMR